MDKKPLNGAKAPQASEGVFGGPAAAPSKCSTYVRYDVRLLDVLSAER